MYNQQPFFMNNMAPCSCPGDHMPHMYPTNIPSNVNQFPANQVPINQQGMVEDMSQLPMEQSYIENILRLNRGKIATVHMSFNGSNGTYEPTIFRGFIEAAGRDHIVLSDAETGQRYLLLMVFLNYVTFDEEIEYSYPFDQLDTYSPR